MDFPNCTILPPLRGGGGSQTTRREEKDTEWGQNEGLSPRRKKGDKLPGFSLNTQSSSSLIGYLFVFKSPWTLRIGKKVFIFNKRENITHFVLWRYYMVLLFFSFSIHYSTQLHLPPLRSIVSEDAGIEPGTVATLAIAAYLLSNK
jgi:hypothetical protein